MPIVTVSLTDEEGRQLAQLAERRERTVEDIAQEFVRRELIRVWAKPAPGSDEARSRNGRALMRADTRMAAQLALARYLETNEMPVGRAEKVALAERLGVKERTLYRYLDIARRAHALEVALPGNGTPDASDDAAT